MIIISPTQLQIQTSIKAFLTSIMPPKVDVVVAQQNRVPEPKHPDFIVISPVIFRRLALNIDSPDGDVRFTASISGTVMAVQTITRGTVAVGATVFGLNVAPGTTVVAPITGGGGVGTYSVSPSQTVASELMAAGVQTIQQDVELTAQLDFHSAPTGNAGDMAQIFSTLFRDQFAVDQFASQVPNYGVSPLYCEDPAQRPFTNEAQQVEWRWVSDAHLQVKQIVSIPLQYADIVRVVPKSVEALFPPT